MGQVRLTTEERIQALERFGYNEREAAFLCQAALHGGYFLRRQYCDFLGKAVGGTAASLIDKVLSKGHAKGTTYATNTHIYHLCARPFYAMLGQEDNRNRRLREPATIKKKLMGLDFVLTHTGYDYLSTEQEKIDYFSSDLPLDRALLPAKRYASRGQITERYFVEKFPIFLSASPLAATPPVVCFCFIDEGLVGVSAFSTFLQYYSALLLNLRNFQIVYVATTDVHFQAAQNAFDRIFRPALQVGSESGNEALSTRLVAHFEARGLYEAQQWSTFDRAKLIRFRDERREFSGENFEMLYRRWKVGGDAALKAFLSIRTASPRPDHGTFLSFRLPQNYDFFGNSNGY